MLEQVFEVDGDKVWISALSREGVWLRLFEIPNTSADKIWNVYRVPLFLKIECSGQDSQSYDAEVSDLNLPTPQEKQS